MRADRSGHVGGTHKAVGVIWQDRADTHLDELLQEAEKRMYEDKAEYYKKTGIERRGADKKG